MNSFKKVLLFLTAAAAAIAPLSGCLPREDKADKTEPTDAERPDDDNDVTDIVVDEKVYDYALDSSDGGDFVYKDGEGNIARFTVSCVSGTDSCYSVTGNTLTFSGLDENSVYSVTGDFYGNIIVEAGEDYKFELELTGFTLTSYSECPVYVGSGDKVTLTAKKDTANYIYDLREEAAEEEISASIYALCDLNVQGKGQLYVKSVNNNGVHTKDDLNVKNLTLQVDCMDNALKGNDSVTVESGDVVLIARRGDGIKTSNSDISSKGNQRGTVTVSGGSLLVYAACDGIDASYNAVIGGGDSDPDIQIYTDKYSKYSEEVTAAAEDVYYIRYTSAAYRYSVYYFNDDSDGIWCNSSDYTAVNAGRTKYYYYSVEKPAGYRYMRVYVYSGSQEQGQSESYVSCTDTLAVNDNYDTFALQNRGNSLSYGWTNYTTSSMGGMGGMGGFNEGNADKGDYSTKGIKADNEVTVLSGTVQISSYDDSIHANADATLENGSQPLGNVTVTGGTLSLYTNDDGIHADGRVEISGGSISVANSYEGIEGGVVHIGGGKVSVRSSDDGVNGTGTSGESIVISGGYLYVYAGGDGLDSNSTSSYGGLLISGGCSVILSTGTADSSIDTERGYRYTGGYVVGIGSSGGMGSESTNCSPSFSTVGSKSTLSLAKDGYLVVENYVTVKLPVSLGALVVFLGSPNASIKSAGSASLSLDSDGVCWSV